MISKIDYNKNSIITEINGSFLLNNNSPIVEWEDKSFYSYEVINHACFPNCYLYIVGRRVFLYSRFFIKSNTELTIDYSISSIKKEIKDCHCSFLCRKKIVGIKYLPNEIVDNYIKESIVSDYFLEKRK